MPPPRRPKRRPSGPKRDLVKQSHVIPHNSGLTNNNPTTMIDEQPPPDPRPRMDLDPATDQPHHPADTPSSTNKPAQIKPMRPPMPKNPHQRGMQNSLPTRPNGRIPRNDHIKLIKEKPNNPPNHEPHPHTDRARRRFAGRA